MWRHLAMMADPIAAPWTNVIGSYFPRVWHLIAIIIDYLVL